MSMPNRRIGVTRDSDLAAALELTRPLLDPAETRSEAGHVRRLALIGADALGTGTTRARAALDRQRLLARPGVRPASRSVEDLPWLDADSLDEDRRASRTLDWVRGDR